MSDASSTFGVEVRDIPGLPITNEPKADPCALVIFGASGDLTRRKLIPALYHLMVDGSLPDPIAVVGVGRDKSSVDELRARLRESTGQFSRRRPLDGQAWDRFAASFDFVSGSFEDDSAYLALRERLALIDRTRGTRGNRIYYLATPPDAFPVILQNLRQHALLTKTSAPGATPFCRVIIEKPFGRDLASAQALNELVANYQDEGQIFRIDHYLGKETVQNILVFRFGNSIFEPLWNRKYIDHVEIVAAESIGVEKRGRFYDTTGVLRDIVQNHLLQVLALCAMEPPTSFAADDVRDQKVRIFRSLRPISGEDVSTQVVRAQYRGYRQEDGVSPRSRTPTYVAMKVMVDTWRWQGVPFYLRAGKRLARQRTEVSIHFQPIPHCLFGRDEACQVVQPSVLTLRIQPQEGISLRFVAKVPGDQLSVGNVLMNMTYAEAFKKPISEAYERLLIDCMRGDATLFARRDGVEQAWKFITPILEAWDADNGTEIPQYEGGSAGPKEADELIAKDRCRWTDLGEG
ncbi:MAG: glucose-6-phosphate dehydrogenase [Deltaproteobacteria bacterium]|nr:glucose-6-phosphate dehydrogenase [Deltaproteobacteria bacterium]